jgi:hypothetical protein
VSLDSPEFISILIAVAKAPEPITSHIGIEAFSFVDGPPEAILVREALDQVAVWEMSQRNFAAFPDAHGEKVSRLGYRRTDDV